MEIIFIVARHDNNTYENFIAPSLSRLKLKCIQIGDKEQSGEIKSITEKYNIAVNVINEQKMINDDNVFVFAHEDVNILDNLFTEKINTVFSQKQEVGLISVVGTEQITENDWWLNYYNKPKGHCIFGDIGNTAGKGNHKEIGSIGYYDNIVCVENFFFAIRGSLLKNINFDIETFKKDDNMYAMDICMQVLKQGYKVAVADMLLFHKSNRNLTSTDKWVQSKKVFNEKYKDLKFPITVDSFNIDKSEIISVEI